MSDALDTILSALTAGQHVEEDLLERLDALLTKPPPDIPEHVVQIFAHARELFGEDTARWLSKPHWNLAHQMPLQAAQSLEGAQRVEDLLTRIAVGMPS